MAYSSQIPKAALAFFGASTATVTGFGIHSALQDKTISDAIIRKGKTLINNTDVFEIAFKQHKEEPTFLTLISSEGNAIEKGTALDKGGVALKNWCNSKLKLDLTEDNIKSFLDNAEKYCSLPWITMREKLKALGKELAEDWDKRLEAITDWQRSEELKTTLVTINASLSSLGRTSSDEKTVWKNALKDWCQEKVNTWLIRDKNDDIFNAMNKYCFENEPRKEAS